MRQGEIRTQGLRGRVVVLSSDRTSAEAYPIVAPLRRDTADFSPYQVPLAQPDPYAGSVEVAKLYFVHPGELGEVLGLVSGATFERLREAAALLFTPR